MVRAERQGCLTACQPVRCRSGRWRAWGIAPGALGPLGADAGGDVGPDVVGGDPPAPADADASQLAAGEHGVDGLPSDRQELGDLRGRQHCGPMLGAVHAERRWHGRDDRGYGLPPRLQGSCELDEHHGLDEHCQDGAYWATNLADGTGSVSR
jgi:hypothetical protein